MSKDQQKVEGPVCCCDHLSLPLVQQTITGSLFIIAFFERKNLFGRYK